MTTRYTIRIRWTALAGLFLLLALMALPPTAIAAGTVTDSNLAEKSAEAKTKADHEALAAYFQEKAADAGKTVERHQQMYRAVAAGGLKGQSGMGWHCRNAIRTARNLQEAYEELAAEHLRMASEAAQ